MKLNIKLLLSTVFALSIVFLGNNVQAQHKHPRVKKKVVQHKKAHIAQRVAHKNSMSQTMKVIKRTNHVIINAHKAVKKQKVYTGNLSKAVHHQRYAKKMLKKHKTHRAMQHSRLARRYALITIRHNKGTINKEYNFSAEENKAIGEAIADAELEKELKDSNPNIKFDDSAISDKEMTELEVLDVDPSDYKSE